MYSERVWGIQMTQLISILFSKLTGDLFYGKK